MNIDKYNGTLFIFCTNVYTYFVHLVHVGYYYHFLFRCRLLSVNFSHINLFLTNQWTKWNLTWQKWYLYGS